MWRSEELCQALYRASTKGSHASSEFTFMSYNVLANAIVPHTKKPMEDEYLSWIGQPSWDEGRKDVVCKTLKKASVFGLTEVTPSMLKGMKSLLPGYDVVLMDKYGGYGDGSAIGWDTSVFDRVGEPARFPLRYGTQVFASQRLKHRSTGVQFAVVVLHLKAGPFHTKEESTRIPQLKNALEYCRKLFEGQTCILCGDFNSDSRNNKTGNCYELMANSEWANVFPNSKTRTHVSGKIYDYIYLKGELRPLGGSVLGDTGSDHFPLIVRLSLTGAPSAGPPSVKAPSSETPYVLRHADAFVPDEGGKIASFDGKSVKLLISASAPSVIKRLMKKVANFVVNDDPKTHKAGALGPLQIYMPMKHFKDDDVHYIILFVCTRLNKKKLVEERFYGCVQKSKRQTKFRILSYLPVDSLSETNIWGPMLMGFYEFLEQVESNKLYATFPQLKEFRRGVVKNKFAIEKKFSKFTDLDYGDVSSSNQSLD